jgi:16S rRNA (cytidine1402-2'-O)-methyltransferase
LWIVATPIGTLADLPPRARDVLAEVDLVLAEDTRRARALFSHFGLPSKGRLMSLHEHNELRQVPKVVEALRNGRSIALISDAGTPVLSDPGFVLVRAVREAGLTVCSVPGPSSFTAALAASGQPPLPATLCGFLPGRGGPRRRRITELAGSPWTLVVLLSPHRLDRELADLAEILGEKREATLLAEISKVHERARVATLGELAKEMPTAEKRGEFILVVGPEVDGEDLSAVNEDDVRSGYQKALAGGMDRREAMRVTARRCGLRRRDVFSILADDGDD